MINIASRQGKTMREVIRYPLAALRDWGYSRFRFLRPNPKDYSTIVGVGSVVPVQIEAYFLALNRYVEENAKILDVGFGLGYGLNILAIKAGDVNGIDIDFKVLRYCQNTIVGRNPRLNVLNIFDGYTIPFSDESFDVVCCVDVIEHVEDFNRLIKEMMRVSRKGVFLSTPNRRPENTNKDGSPKNYWHLREWDYPEFDEIVRKFGSIEWRFINGANEGPFTISTEIDKNTLALAPFIFKVRV
ncbi:MAG TPA: class I SAM-dependent methyltransferase [Methanoregula sp.]|nr:class I SAM-dependent methyltransferase [Methanoregula sp.]